MTKLSVVAIPGQPTTYLPPPVDAPAAAVAAIDALASDMIRRVLFGFLQPPKLRAHWHSQIGLSLYCDRDLTHTCNGAVSIDWRWGVLWQADDWYEVGWHPGRQYFSLACMWQRRVWDALNPGKRIIHIRYSGTYHFAGLAVACARAGLK